MSDVEPALTAEEWARFLRDIQDGRRYAEFEASWGEDLYGHAAAALALHGQPFGFTWKDVDVLQSRIDDMRKTAQPIGPLHALWDVIFDLESLADRIAALLPPREP